MGFFQFVHCPADAGLVTDEGGANGISANQTDDIRCHFLVGQFRYGGVELLGGKALPIQRQAQDVYKRQLHENVELARVVSCDEK